MLTSLIPVLAVQASNTCICYGDSSFCYGGLELSNSRCSKASLSRCGTQAMKKNVGSTVLSFWQFEKPFKEQEQEL